MRNIKLTIEYDGTDYCGWQAQNGTRARSIQRVIEQALTKVFQKKISLIGSGRTDSGVHASNQTANFKTDSHLPLTRIRSALNSYLPQDIVIKKAEQVDEDFHARFGAKSKVYRYSVLNAPVPSPFNRRYSLFAPYPLDIEKMKKAAAYLQGRHNVRSFHRARGKQKNFVRTIKKLKITRKNELIFFEIEAEGFLYHMVRIIVGTLLEVGRGRFGPGYLKEILKGKNRKLAGPTVPSRGLCLMRVKY